MNTASMKKAILMSTLAVTMAASAMFGANPTPCHAAFIASGDSHRTSYEEFALLHTDGPCAQLAAAHAG